MLTGLVAALGKDLRLLARARVGLVFLILAPIVVIWVAGLSLATLYGAEPRGGTAPVLPVADEDGGWVGRAVRERLADEPSVRVRPVATAAAARALVQAKRAAAALVVPAGASEAIGGGRAPALVLPTHPPKTGDGAHLRAPAPGLRPRPRAGPAGAAPPRAAPPPPGPPGVPPARGGRPRAAPEAVGARRVAPDGAPAPPPLAPPALPAAPSLDLPALPEPPAGRLPGPLALEETSVTGAPRRLNTFDQNVPGFGVTFLLLGVLLGVSLGLLDEREWGTLERVRSMPMSLATLLVAKLAARAAVGTVQMALLFLVGRLAFRVSLGPQPSALLLPTAGIPVSR